MQTTYKKLCCVALILLYTTSMQPMDTSKPNPPNIQPKAATNFQYKTFSNWYTALQKCKTLRSIMEETKKIEIAFNEIPEDERTSEKLESAQNKIDTLQKPTSPLTWNELKKTLGAFFKLTEQNFTQADWLNDESKTKLPKKALIYKSKTDPLFVQKLELPAKSTVAISGDLHGDAHSLLAMIKKLQQENFLENDSFTIKNENFYMLFLGDYVDKGMYGSEVIYTLLRLKLANPEKVFMVRGNHEEIYVNTYSAPGFFELWREKFGLTREVFQENFGRLYRYLPIALYLGSGNDYALCCHGGLELGYNSKKFLNQKAKNFFLYDSTSFEKLQAQRGDNATKLCPDESETIKNQPCIGFMWNDFFFGEENFHDSGIGRLKFGKSITENALQSLYSSTDKRVRAILRAHQHGGDAIEKIISHGGIFEHWEEEENLNNGKLAMVSTFNVAPDAGYDHDNHTFGLLSLAQKYDDWHLKKLQVTPYGTEGSEEETLGKATSTSTGT